MWLVHVLTIFWGHLKGVHIVQMSHIVINWSTTKGKIMYIYIYISVNNVVDEICTGLNCGWNMCRIQANLLHPYTSLSNEILLADTASSRHVNPLEEHPVPISKENRGLCFWLKWLGSKVDRSTLFAVGINVCATIPPLSQLYSCNIA